MIQTVIIKQGQLNDQAVNLARLDSALLSRKGEVVNACSDEKSQQGGSYWKVSFPAAGRHGSCRHLCATCGLALSGFGPFGSCILSLAELLQICLI